MLNRLVRALEFVHSLLHAILLTFVLGMVAAMFAAWLGGGWPVILGAGAVGLIGGAAVSKRAWFGREAPSPSLPVLAELRKPGLQDEFDRLLARQRVLAFLFIAAVLLLALSGLAKNCEVGRLGPGRSRPNLATSPHRTWGQPRGSGRSAGRALYGKWHAEMPSGKPFSIRSIHNSGAAAPSSPPIARNWLRFYTRPRHSRMVNLCVSFSCA